MSVAAAAGLPEEPAARHAALSALALPPGSVRAYIEAHMEQGPVLEAEGEAVGIVRAISGQSRLQVQIAGEQGHAGAAPPPCSTHLSCHTAYARSPRTCCVCGLFEME